MANILILGGGFGGLVTAEKLADQLDSAHNVTLVCPNRKFTFYPALVQLAFGACEPDDITFDLTAKMKDFGVRSIEGEAIFINPERRTVNIVGQDFNGEVFYDYLVVAIGHRLATEKTPGFFEYANHLLGMNAALRFGERVRNFSAGEIVVGMCPEARLPVPVCETAFALGRKFENEIREGKIQIKVVFPESLEKAFGGADIHRELQSAFKRHGINVLYEFPVTEILPNEIIAANKERIYYDLLMLVPPFSGQRIVSRLGERSADPAGFALVNGKMQIHGLEKIYAVGDIAAFSGPKFAHMAVRQASVAAENILTEIRGGAPAAEYYHEINAIIDSGGADSIHLHYGIWDDTVFALHQGAFWRWAKNIHDRLWHGRHGYFKE